MSNFFSDVMTAVITRPDQVMLAEVSDLDKFEDKEFSEGLAKLYKGNTNLKLLAVLFNAVVTQNKITFLFSKRIFENLIAQDNNLDRKTINSETFKQFMTFVRNNKILDVVVKGTSIGEASVFEAIHPYWTEVVIKKVSREFLAAQKQICIKIHKSSHPTSQGRSHQIVPSDSPISRSHEVTVVISCNKAAKEAELAAEVINKQNETSLLVQSLQTGEELLTKAVGIQAEGDIQLVPPNFVPPPKLTKQELADRLHCDFCFYLGRYADETAERILDLALTSDVETGSALRDLAEVIMSNPETELRYMSEHHLLALFRAVNTPTQLLP